VKETNHFFNPGYGWLCKHCSAEDTEHQNEHHTHPRFFREGEAEEKEPKLSTAALARWTDASRQHLTCPRCGIEELINKA
jgi:hypothetical protein